MAVLRYFHQDPRQTSVQESSVIDKQGTVLTQKLTTINQSITNNTQVLEDKLNSVPGKSLSTNDFTDEYKNKLRGIEEGAEVNVQSDWGEDDNTADSYIKNKPVIDDIVTQDSENLITSGAVFTAIDELPEPMIFKGSLGTGGTIQTLPAPSADNVGFVYKVITAGAYYGITAKPGDSFISDGSDWILIPSGDEPEGTVMSVGLTVPTGLLVSGSPITTSGTLAITYALGYAIPTTAKLDEWDAKQNAISDLSTIRTNASNGNTAYGWGNHANAGYVKSSGVTSVAMTVPTGLSISGSPITSTGTLALSFANGYSIPTTAKLSNWDTAYGWGNHASAGYLTGITKTMVTNALGYTPPQQDTNTWRGITDSYSGTDSSISLSQKGGNSLYNALVNGYANEAGTLAVKYKLTDGSTSSVIGYRLFGSQTLSGGWLNKRIAFLVCDRHTSNGIVFINYGIETAASAYTWNAAYCDIKYFGATSDTSLLMYCYVKLNNTNSVTFNFFWNHSDYSDLDIRLLLTWNSPFTISNDGAFVSSIDTNTYGTLKATMQRNEAINADTLDGYHYNNLPYLTGITKAMVTNALGYTPPTSDTNNAVTLTNTATNASYRVLMSVTADDTTRTEGARKSTNLLFNPSAGKLSVSQSIRNTDEHNRSGGWNTYEQGRGISVYDCTGSSDRGAPSNYYATGLHVAGQYWFLLAFERGDNRLLYRGGNAEGVTRSWSRIHTYGDNEYACVGKMWIQCDTDDSHVIIGALNKSDDSAGPWVGIGKVNPSYKLHVNGACGATSFPNTSDIRLKDILSDWLPKLEDIANAPSFLFKWNNIKDDTVHLGSSAQYWEEKAPNVVTEANDEIKTKSLQYDVLGTVNSIAIAKEGVSLKEEIKLLQALIAELKLLLNN